MFTKLCGAAVIVSSSIAMGASAPIPVTGWTVDDIAGKTEAFPYSNANVNSWSFYEAGRTTSSGSPVSQGLPVDSNRTLTTTVGTPFQLAPYAGNNTAILNPGNSVELTLQTPGSFQNLQFLDVDGNGNPTTWHVQLNFNDAGSPTVIGDYHDKDWTNGNVDATDGSVAFTFYGLVQQANQDAFYSGYLYAAEHTFNLSAADQARTLKSITVTNTDQGNLMFLGVSGTAAVPEPASLSIVGLAALGLFGRRRHA